MSSKKKALVVDDTAFHRDFLKVYLRIKGFEVTTANDGVLGLSAAKQEGFEIIFSDIEMPNMNGIEFLRMVKRLQVSAILAKIAALREARAN